MEIEYFDRDLFPCSKEDDEFVEIDTFEQLQIKNKQLVEALNTAKQCMTDQGWKVFCRDIGNDILDVLGE